MVKKIEIIEYEEWSKKCNEKVKKDNKTVLFTLFISFSILVVFYFIMYLNNKMMLDQFIIGSVFTISLFLFYLFIISTSKSSCNLDKYLKKIDELESKKK